MSRFFSLLNSTNIANTIDDDNISTVTSYSSYKITDLFNNMSSSTLKCGFKEYSPNSSDRSSPQQIFETPNSYGAVLMWVLREGVKMTLNNDYVLLDNTHIKFNTEVSPKYTVSILVISSNISNSSNGNSMDLNNKYIYYQASPSKCWHVNHNLGFQYPNILLVDDLNNKVEADIQYIDDNNCVVNFDMDTTGKCICSV